MQNNAPRTFDNSDRDEILSRADIGTVIGRYVALKQAGANLKGLCPFHKEKTPSFNVNPEKGIFHCFGCGKGGDVFTFLMEIEGLDFKDALKQMADETGVQLKRNTTSSLQDSSPVSAPSGDFPSKTEMLTLHDQVARFYYKQIAGNATVIDYFKGRGLRAETVRDFMLGYAPAGWSALSDYAKTLQVSDAALLGCGLAIKRNEGQGTYDRFRDRIMFPLNDITGKVIGFAGRGMAADAIPKYLNSPETPLYQKSKFLYGLHKSKTAIKEKHCAIVVEGYVDYLTLFQEGVQNVVACSGTALTAEHGHILRRFTSTIILVFDGDSAGQNAARRGGGILMPLGLEVKVFILPEEHDPDSFVRANGAAAFTQALETARPYTDYIIDDTVKRLGTSSPHQQSAVITALSPLALAITDRVIAAAFVKQLADRLMMTVSLTQARINDTRTRGGQSPAAADPVRITERYLSTIEGSFISFLLNNPHYCHEAKALVAPETFTDSFSGKLYSMVLDCVGSCSTVQTLIGAAIDPEYKRIIASVLAVQSPVKQSVDDLAHLIKRIQAKWLRAQIRSIKNQIQNNPAHSAELLKNQKELSTQLLELNRN